MNVQFDFGLGWFATRQRGRLERDLGPRCLCGWRIQRLVDQCSDCNGYNVACPKLAQMQQFSIQNQRLTFSWTGEQFAMMESLLLRRRHGQRGQAHVVRIGSHLDAQRFAIGHRHRTGRDDAARHRPAVEAERHRWFANACNKISISQLNYDCKTQLFLLTHSSHPSDRYSIPNNFARIANLLQSLRSRLHRLRH